MIHWNSLFQTMTRDVDWWKLNKVPGARARYAYRETHSKPAKSQGSKREPSLWADMDLLSKQVCFLNHYICFQFIGNEFTAFIIAICKRNTGKIPIKVALWVRLNREELEILIHGSFLSLPTYCFGWIRRLPSQANWLTYCSKKLQVLIAIGNQLMSHCVTDWANFRYIITKKKII